MRPGPSPLRVLLGLVGESPVVDEFPLGPRLAQRLRAQAWPAELTVEVQAMNWGALHIVQGLEGRRGEHDRVVLVACVQRGGRVGALHQGRWLHDTLPTLAMQERIFEAVTGIVSLDNLLVIGEHFKVWPAEVLTVEVEAPESLFGDMVQLAAAAKEAGGAPDWRAALGFEPAAVVDALAAAVHTAVLHGAVAPGPWEPRRAATMQPTQPWHVVAPATGSARVH